MFKRIPSEIKNRKQWVCFDSKKRPIDPKKSWLCYSSVTNQDTWGTFEQAVETCRRLRLSGIGYVFSADDPFVGVDIDNCRNPNDGTITAEAMLITKLLSSYTEISPSGTGLHIIVKAKLPFRGKQGEVFEIYDSGRYFTMIGYHYSPTPSTIKTRNIQIFMLLDKYFPHLLIQTSDEQIAEIIRKYCKKVAVMVSPWKNKYNNNKI